VKEKMVEKRGTTIFVSLNTHKRLCKIGRKGETFDEIIQRLLSKSGGVDGNAKKETLN
jgi:predicted CopG family antitoxin